MEKPLDAGFSSGLQGVFYYLKYVGKNCCLVTYPKHFQTGSKTALRSGSNKPGERLCCLIYPLDKSGLHANADGLLPLPSTAPRAASLPGNAGPDAGTCAYRRTCHQWLSDPVP